MAKPLLILVPLALILGACTTPTANSGLLSTYEGLTPRPGTSRVSLSERKDEAGLKGLARVALAPTRIAPGPETAWLTPAEALALGREIDGQICFEMTERYDLAPADQADAMVSAIVSRVGPTGRVGSLAAAAGSYFIPGPIGLRPPGTLGALGAEAELLDRDGRQIAAITWTRDATAVGTDSPSLSRIGDALQFAEPLADDVAKVMTGKETRSRKIPDPDPCAAYGARLRVEGIAASIATGLYVPQLSGAQAAPVP